MPEDDTLPSTTIAPSPTATGDEQGSEAKARFAKAVEEAKGGAAAVAKEAQERAGVYRDLIASKGSDLVEDAKGRAAGLAEDGKSRASDALSGLGKIVAENAPVIDEKLGPQYGDYARSAARSIQDAAARIDAKELNEIGEDLKNFVQKSPGLAVGIAAVAGFMLARLFRSSDD